MTEDKFILTEQEAKQYTLFKCPASNNYCPGRFSIEDIQAILEEEELY